MNDGKGYLKKRIKLHTLPIDMQTHAMTKMKVVLPGAGFDMTRKGWKLVYYRDG